MKTTEKDLVRSSLDSLAALDPQEVQARSSQYNVSGDFTEKELQAVDNLASKIDVFDSAALISYGSASQDALAKFSDSRLSDYSTASLGAAGDQLTDLIVNLKSIGVNPEEEKNIFKKLFHSGKKELQTYRATFNTVSANVEDAKKELQKHLTTLTASVADFDEMYELNLSYYRELTLYIMAGRKKIEYLKSLDLPELLKVAQASGSQIDAEHANDLASAINSFEKKLLSLETSRQLVIQQACQIRQLQKTNRSLAEQILMVIMTAIPTWKNTMRINLGLEDTEKAIAALDLAKDFTNTMLQENAKKLHQVAVKTTEASMSPVISIETAQITTDEFITSLNETLQIERDGMRNIHENERIIHELEEKRKAALLDFSRQLSADTIESALEPSGTPRIPNPKSDVRKLTLNL